MNIDRIKVEEMQYAFVLKRSITDIIFLRKNI